MKNVVKIVTVVLLVCVVMFALAGCSKEKENNNQTTVVNRTTPVENNNTPAENNNTLEEDNHSQNEVVPKSEQIGTAGSSIPLKDNLDEAKYQVKVAFQNWLVETYGDAVFDARINVEKIYTVEEEQENSVLQEENLGPDEVAFEVKYELKPAQGADVNRLTIPNGQYDEESGWIKEKYNLGILRPNTSGEEKYIVTNIGTGW